jgi:hypothetical protein
MGKTLGRIARWLASSSANLFALWTMLMSGILSLSREVYFAYMASTGHPVSPTGVLQVFGHLSIAAFFSTWRTASSLRSRSGTGYQYAALRLIPQRRRCNN